VDLSSAQRETEREVGSAPDETQSKWARMKADASAKMEDIKAKVDKRDEEIDADMAATDADFAEAEASDAIGYAEWVVDNARLAVLDALDARAYAAERAKAAAANP
jgi:glycerol-3-phosphate dehydrogenase